MTRKLSDFPLYPLLLAAYFPLYLMSADLGMTNLADVVRPLLVCVVLALVSTAVLGRVLRDVHRAALWVAMAFIVIFDFLWDGGDISAYLQLRDGDSRFVEDCPPAHLQEAGGYLREALSYMRDRTG